MLKDLQREADDYHRLLKLQLELSKKLRAVEAKARSTRSLLQESRRLVRQGHTTKRESKRRKARVRSVNEKLAQYRKLLLRLKAIGDGIAHIYFDRWDLKPVAYRQSSGFISGKAGHAFEKKALRHIIRQGVPAILCDLTDGLRFADILVANGATPAFIEVKKQQDRPLKEERQMAAIEKVANYLRTDQAINLFDEDGITIRRVPLGREPRYNVDEVNRAVRRAYASKAGAAAVVLEEGVAFLAFRESATCVPMLGRMLEEIASPWVAHLNEGLDNWPPSYPYTLNLYDPQHVFDFMANELYLVVVLDLAVLARLFSERAVTIEFALHSDSPIRILSAGQRFDEINNLRIGYPLVSRLFTEFLSLESFVDITLDRLDAMRSIVGKHSSSQEILQ